jgi:hypothetical protein
MHRNLDNPMTTLASKLLDTLQLSHCHSDPQSLPEEVGTDAQRATQHPPHTQQWEQGMMA